MVDDAMKVQDVINGATKGLSAARMQQRLRGFLFLRRFYYGLFFSANSGSYRYNSD